MGGHVYQVCGAAALALLVLACEHSDNAASEQDLGGTTSSTNTGTGTGGLSGGVTQPNQGTPEEIVNPGGASDGVTNGAAAGTTTGGVGAGSTETGGGTDTDDTTGSGADDTTGSGADDTTGGGADDTTGGGTDDTTGTGGDGGDGAELVNPGPGDAMFFGANFWYIDWEGADSYFSANVDFATTTNPWRADLLQDLQPYRVLRFMDWNKVNFAENSQANWSTRKPKAASQLTAPVAFEWQIDLCNRTQTDYWVSIPSQASPAYWTQLAELIHAELDPKLRVYVEWSNETWNTLFPQATDATAQGQNLGLSGTNPSSSFTVYQSVRVFEAFKQVFGDDRARVVNVISGQSAWWGVCEARMAALKDPVINPSGTMPDAFAIAPYFGGATPEALAEEAGATMQGVEGNAVCANGAGIPLITYEGGQDSYAGAGGSDCRALQHNPGLYDVYTDFFDAMADHIEGPFIHYTHSGDCWGLLQNAGDSLDISPKYRAVVDWIAAHP